MKKGVEGSVESPGGAALRWRASRDQYHEKMVDLAESNEDVQVLPSGQSQM